METTPWRASAMAVNINLNRLLAAFAVELHHHRLRSEAAEFELVPRMCTIYPIRSVAIRAQ